MTILFDKISIDFDPDPKFAEYDWVQPLVVHPSDAFVVLTQVDSGGQFQHTILVERRDVKALIEALQRSTP